jgi:hypothetical protein
MSQNPTTQQYFSPRHTTFYFRHSGRPSLVVCPQLIIQYIHTYPLSITTYLEAFSICNLRICHAVVIRDPIKWPMLSIK